MTNVCLYGGVGFVLETYLPATMTTASYPALDVNTLEAPAAGPRNASGMRHYKPQIGRYVILHQLGAGGMGAVFAAYDEKLDRKVALKLLHNHNQTPEDQHQRTLREAKALARIAHPRVVTVYDAGEADGQVYLAMEFIDGMTLRKWQSAQPRHWHEILAMYLEVGAGLHAAHLSGIVHRDFKPDNVLVGKDELPRVADFGIARLEQRQTDDAQEALAPPTDNGATLTGNIVGTVGYMSPEQHNGTRIDANSDQWSYCAALFEALYGYLPFAGATLAEHAHNLRTPIRPPPADCNVPPEIFRILSRGFAIDPAARFPDMQTLLRHLMNEHEQSAASAASSRRVLVGVVASACLGVWLLLQYLLGQRARIVSYAMLLSIALVASTAIAGIFHRETLRQNAFHRSMWAMILTTFIQMLFIRAIFTLRGPLPASLEVGLEMLVWTGTCLTMTITLIRRMWWVTLVPFLTCAFAILSESPSKRIMLCGYPIVVGLVLWHWRAAAKTRTT